MARCARDSGKIQANNWHGNGKEPDKRINIKRMLCYIIYVPHINIVSVKATNITI